MTKPLTYDQGPAFQAHSLQIILLGPLTYESNAVLGSLNNRVPTALIMNLNSIEKIVFTMGLKHGL